jgi:hypothetical protein
MVNAPNVALNEGVLQGVSAVSRDVFHSAELKQLSGAIADIKGDHMVALQYQLRDHVFA